MRLVATGVWRGVYPLDFRGREESWGPGFPSVFPIIPKDTGDVSRVWARNARAQRLLPCSLLVSHISNKLCCLGRKFGNPKGPWPTLTPDGEGPAETRADVLLTGVCYVHICCGFFFFPPLDYHLIIWLFTESTRKKKCCGKCTASRGTRRTLFLIGGFFTPPAERNCNCIFG